MSLQNLHERIARTIEAARDARSKAQHARNCAESLAKQARGAGMIKTAEAVEEIGQRCATAYREADKAIVDLVHAGRTMPVPDRSEASV